MQAFEISHRSVERGIGLTGQTIILGGTRQRQTQASLAIDGASPPEVDGARVVRSGVARRGDALVLVSPEPADRRAVVRIVTPGAASRASDGRSDVYWGSPRRVARGTLNHPANLQLAGWDDSLWIMSPGEAVIVVPAGGKAGGEVYLVVWDGLAIRCTTTSEWIASTIPRWLATATADEAESAADAARQRKYTRLVEALTAQTEVL